MSNSDFTNNILNFKKNVKNKFPSQKEIDKANNTVKQQTLDRLKEELPDTNSATAYYNAVEKAIDKEQKQFSLKESVEERKVNEKVEERQIKFSLPDTDSVNDYINSNPTEFAEVPPVRDYEKKAAHIRLQTMDELKTQIERLKKDKRLTHGKVLDERSVREEMNALVRTLMSRSEGTPLKTDHRLVDVAVKNASIIYKAIKDDDYAEAANTAYYTAQHIAENLEFIDDVRSLHIKNCGTQ